jgi:hypothetical protein
VTERMRSCGRPAELVAAVALRPRAGTAKDEHWTRREADGSKPVDTAAGENAGRRRQ